MVLPSTTRRGSAPTPSAASTSESTTARSATAARSATPASSVAPASAPCDRAIRTAGPARTRPGGSMIRAVLFDLDNTLTDFVKMKDGAIAAAVEAMIDMGLPLAPEEARRRIYAHLRPRGDRVPARLRPVPARGLRRRSPGDPGGGHHRLPPRARLQPGALPARPVDADRAAPARHPAGGALRRSQPAGLAAAAPSLAAAHLRVRDHLRRHAASASPRRPPSGARWSCSGCRRRRS